MLSSVTPWELVAGSAVSIFALVGAVTSGVLLLRWVVGISRRLRRGGAQQEDGTTWWAEVHRRELEGATRVLERATVSLYAELRYPSGKKVVILRGIPGAGKSAYAEKTLPHAAIVSADKYYMDSSYLLEDDGIAPVYSYEYKPDELVDSHCWCFLMFLRCLLNGDTPVVVDNTSIEAWEIAPYVLAGRAFGYDVEIVTLRCAPDVAAARCAHGVSTPAVHARAAALDLAVLPPHWNHRVLEYPAYESGGEESRAADGA